MALSWNFYTHRRNIDVDRLIQHHRIDSYHALCTFLSKKGVTPPEVQLTEGWEWYVISPPLKVSAPVLERLPVSTVAGSENQKNTPSWKRKKAPKKSAKKTSSKKT